MTNTLSQEEIETILLAASEIIMYGGKGLLGKILAGSKDKRIFTSNLQHSPAYGAFKGMKQKEIMEKVEWMFEHGYLASDDRLSLLVYTEKGWNTVNLESTGPSNDGQLIHSFEANKKWLALPADFRQKLTRNVFCGRCRDTVQIEKYIIRGFKNAIVLEGHCKSCGGNITRMVEFNEGEGF